MGELRRVIGQNHITDHFKNAIKMDKISHAYILNGEADSGKRDLALRFAMALQCEKNDGEPCMKCRSCRQALSGNQPDIKWITYEKSGIGVDEIREQVNNDIVIKPYSSRRKIYIVPDSEKMTVQAQNALLKTIEEPPAYAVIILLTTNADMFLQTILSRCVILNIRSVKEDIIRNYLRTDFGINDYDASVAAAFSGGNPGKAVKLATSEDFNALRDEVVLSITSIVNGSMADVTAAIKRASDYKSDIEEYISILRIWFRDILVYKSCKKQDMLVFQSEQVNIMEMCKSYKYSDINVILRAIEEAANRLKSNVNFDATLEVLFLTIKERIRK